MKESDPKAFEKLSVIEGDAMELNLGITETDRQKLLGCSIIFHCAASVRFDDSLRKAILLNTRGTREICKLAQEIPKLKALVHVSTAFIQPKNVYVEEKIIAAAGGWEMYIKFAEKLDEPLLDLLTPKLTNYAVNTYTFTKNMAEHICIDYRKKFNLPVAILRPSVVACEYFFRLSEIAHQENYF